jgi:hypothetical protein
MPWKGSTRPEVDGGDRNLHRKVAGWRRERRISRRLERPRADSLEAGDGDDEPHLLVVSARRGVVGSSDAMTGTCGCAQLLHVNVQEEEEKGTRVAAEEGERG